MLYLVAKSGVTRGVTWALAPGRHVLGRDSDADIVIADPLVSRRHCAFEAENGTVRMVDLGAQNAVLVNGEPVREAELRPGDEVAIGRVVLLLSEERPMAAGREGASPSTTARFKLDETPGVTAGGSMGLATVHDLYAAVRAARALADAGSTPAFWQTLGDTLREHYKPESLWMGEWLQGHWELRPSGGKAAAEAPASALLEELLRSREGVALRGTGRRAAELELCAPLLHQDHAIGAVRLVVSQEPGGDAAALAFLAALLGLAAPLYLGLERRTQLEVEAQTWRAKGQERAALLGKSAVMCALRDDVRRAAGSESPVLIQGETGSGKELIAQMLHACSPRAARHFVPVNCAAIPEHLVESELFGHEKGSFTGANQRRIGWVQEADGGTLFLDEVGDLSAENQARLLRVIETRRFRRVGGNEEIASDFRLVTASNRDLATRVAAGAFRSDLYYRLRVLEIGAPPLRQHRTDIPELAEHFLTEVRLKSNRVLHGISDDAYPYLQSLSWPGNVRELKHAIEAAASFTPDGWISETVLRRVIRELDCKPFTPMPMAELERQHILKTMEYCNGRVVEAARLLGIGKSALYEKVAKYRDENGGAGV